MYYNFETDLHVGINAENRFEIVAQELIGGEPRRSSNHTFDMQLSGCRIECKMDVMAANTGNIAIEIAAYGRPSGIATTLADAFVYIIGVSIAYIVDTETLRRLVKECRTKAGGDKINGVGQAIFALLPINRLEQHSVKVLV